MKRSEKEQRDDAWADAWYAKYRAKHAAEFYKFNHYSAGRKQTKCVVCGQAVVVMNNLNFYKTPLCDSPVCKRARKTALQRARRYRGVT